MCYFFCAKFAMFSAFTTVFLRSLQFFFVLFDFSELFRIFGAFFRIDCFRMLSKFEKCSRTFRNVFEFLTSWNSLIQSGFGNVGFRL